MLSYERGFTQLTVASGLIGIVAAVVGTYFAVTSYLDAQPNIKLRNVRASIESAYGDLNLPERLGSVEEQFGEVTGLEVIRLRDFALSINPSSEDYPSQLENFLPRLQEAIRHFDEVPEPISPDEISIADGQLILPDGFSADLRDSETLALFPEFSATDREAIQSQIIDGDGILSPEIAAEIRDVFAAALNTGRGRLNEPLRTQVSAELRKIRQNTQDVLNGKDQRIGVKFTALNSSSRPNAISGIGLLGVKGGIVREDIEVFFDENFVIEPFSIKPVRVSSQRLNQLSEAKRKAVEHALDKEYTVFLILEDVHGEIWYEEGSFSSFAGRRDLSSMRMELEDLLR